jgi:hypothetical protein
LLLLSRHLLRPQALRLFSASLSRASAEPYFAFHFECSATLFVEEQWY